MKNDVTLGRLKEVIHYDADTGVFTWKIEIKKGQIFAGDRAGAHLAPTAKVCLISIDGTRYAAHRLAWFYHYGVWPTQRVDHRNGDFGDNKILNLREATHAQNMHNRKRCRRNKSGVKGVAWCPHRNKWRAKIQCNGKTITLGRYDTVEEAGTAYRAAAIRLHGEFACCDR